jgi:hypothetical protein
MFDQIWKPPNTTQFIGVITRTQDSTLPSPQDDSDFKLNSPEIKEEGKDMDDINNNNNNNSKKRKKRVTFSDQPTNVEPLNTESKTQEVINPRKDKRKRYSKTTERYEVDHLVDKYIGSNGQIQYLVHWKGYPDTADTWESPENLASCKGKILEYENLHRDILQRQYDRSLELKQEQAQVVRNNRKSSKFKSNNNVVVEEKKESPPPSNPEIKSESVFIPPDSSEPLPSLDENVLLTGNLGEKEKEIIKDQQFDSDFKPLLDYLGPYKLLPNDSQLAQKILKESNYYLIDPINKALYHIQVGKHQRNYQEGMEIKTLCIPKIHRPFIMYHYHNNLFAAHLGMNRTYQRIHSRFYWPNIYREVNEFVACCPECQISKSRKPTNIPVGSLPVPSYPFHTIALDFIGPFNPPSEGKNYVLVIMDYFTRYVILVPTVSVGSFEIADAIIKHVLTTFGAPEYLLSDRGPAFLSSVMKGLYEWMHTHKLNTSAYHPQTNGLVERFNQTLITILMNTMDFSKENWAELLPLAQFAYNTSIQDTLGEAPSFVLFGRLPAFPGPEVSLHQDARMADLCEYLALMQNTFPVIQEKIKSQLQAAQLEYLKRNENLKSVPSYEPGDLVWVHAVENRGPKEYSDKLIPKWMGPFIVIRKMSPVTYEVRYSTDPKAQNQVIHLLRLKPFKQFNPSDKAEQAAWTEHQLEVARQLRGAELIDEYEEDMKRDEEAKINAASSNGAISPIYRLSSLIKFKPSISKNLPVSLVFGMSYYSSKFIKEHCRYSKEGDHARNCRLRLNELKRLTHTRIITIDAESPNYCDYLSHIMFNSPSDPTHYLVQRLRMFNPRMPILNIYFEYLNVDPAKERQSYYNIFNMFEELARTKMINQFTNIYVQDTPLSKEFIDQFLSHAKNSLCLPRNNHLWLATQTISPKLIEQSNVPSNLVSFRLLYRIIHPYYLITPKDPLYLHNSIIPVPSETVSPQDVSNAMDLNSS